MNRYDENYSAYFAAPDEAYPIGSAVDASNEDNLDGTPILAAFFNDVIGFMQATFFGAFGTDAQVSGTPESCLKSNVWEAIQKFVGDKVQVVKDAVENEAETRSNEDTKLQGEIDAINAVVPAQASANNQLADKDFVNSSIATNTAYFIGTFDSITQLEGYTGTKTNNDYAFVRTTDSTEQNIIFKRYKWNGHAWLFEYSLNNSSFTADQWASINSGATTAKINQIKNMSGATASNPGAAGFVPQPPAGAQGKFLRGDGTWTDAASVVLQAAFNAAHPVGCTYVQFPQQDNPSTVFNKNGVTSTWTVIDYKGAFFRAQGGMAAAFVEKTDVLSLQEEGLPNINGSFYSSGDYTYNGSNYSGCFSSGNSYTRKDSEAASVHTYPAIEFSAQKSNSIYGNSSHVTPVNYTIRIWIRTS